MPLLKYISVALTCLCSCVLVNAQKTSDTLEDTKDVIRCFTDENTEKLQQKYPNAGLDVQTFEKWIAPKIDAYQNRPAFERQQKAVITIPVVIHVIHDGDPINTPNGPKSENISNAQAMSQIEVLNEDFRRLMGSRGAETSGYNLGVDVEVQFCLATQDPNGNATNGINRVNLCQPTWIVSNTTNEVDDVVKPQTIWDPTKYMNMWSVSFTPGSTGVLLGFAQFPSSSGLDGLPNSGGLASTDGVVANFNVFGTADNDDGSFILDDTFRFGRTMTHEVGHFLGLRHIWGDGNCDEDDFCEDTPTAVNFNTGCTAGVTCGSQDMNENYMDYTDDECMNTFTQDQKDRMLTVLQNSPRRMELGSSVGCAAGTTFVNEVEVLMTCQRESICDFQFNPGFEIINLGTANVTSATIDYTIDGVADTFEFVGTLEPFGIAALELPAIANQNGTFDIAISVDSVNGTTDEFTPNNTDSKEFTFNNSSENAEDFDAVTFNLSLLTDDFGEETTFTIEDDFGNIVASGGPYPDRTQIDESFTLPNNACYAFTIFDTADDGLCCGFGNGSYSLTTDDDGTVVAQGAEFTSMERTVFRAASSLSVEEQVVDELLIYPNPTSNVLNIAAPSTALPENYIIFNATGQKVRQQRIADTSDLAIDVSGLQSGFYFIQIDNQSAQTVLKFVKQ